MKSILFLFTLCSIFIDPLLSHEVTYDLMKSEEESRRSLSSTAEEHEQLIIFAFCGMTIGALITHVLSRFKTGLPYTVVVFLTGGIISLILDSDINFAHYENSFKAWKKIDPELLLYLFLPALLFGEAMSLRWYNVKAVFSQALLLAGPGVLIGAYAMALFLYVCMPFGWSWYLCVIFGSIVSATDPVAVVALLKDVGAAPKLTILIIGESLMNDGTAMVLFTLYFNMMEGHKYDGGEIILFFLKECLGSPLLGIGMGLVGVYWLGKAGNPLSPVDITIQIVITVVTAYLVFFVAQYECEVSGVLACCAAGIMFAWLAPPLILEHETMHSVWSFIEWVGNTLIFLLAGLIIGGSSEETHISHIDYFYVVVLYFALMAIRCMNIALLYPFLRRTGLKCSSQDAKFMSWAGLRGALAVALSLVVYGDYEELGISKNDADKVFFYVGGIAAMTLVVNATTAQKVLVYLGLLKDDNNAHDLAQLNSIRTRLRNDLMDDLSHIQTGYCYGADQKRSESRDSSEASENPPDSSESAPTPEPIGYLVENSDILRFNSLLLTHDDEINKTSEKIGEALAVMYRNKTPADMVQDAAGHCYHPEMLAYYRTVFLENIRAKYWQFIDDSKLPRQAPVTQTLLYSVDSALRRVDYEASRDWSFLQKEMRPNRLDRFVEYTRELPLMQSMSALRDLHDHLETRRMYFMVYVLTSFIDAQEGAQETFSTMMGSTELGVRGSVSSVDSHEEKGNQCSQRKSSNTPGKITHQHSVGTLHEFPEQKKVLEESMKCVKEAKEMLGLLHREVVTSVLVEQAARMLLAKEIKHVQEMMEEGLVHQKVADKLLEAVSDDLKALDKEQAQQFKKNAQITASLRSSMILTNLPTSTEPSSATKNPVRAGLNISV